MNDGSVENEPRRFLTPGQWTLLLGVPVLVAVVATAGYVVTRLLTSSDPLASLGSSTSLMVGILVVVVLIGFFVLRSNSLDAASVGPPSEDRHSLTLKRVEAGSEGDVYQYTGTGETESRGGEIEVVQQDDDTLFIQEMPDSEAASLDGTFLPSITPEQTFQRIAEIVPMKMLALWVAIRSLAIPDEQMAAYWLLFAFLLVWLLTMVVVYRDGRGAWWSGRRIGMMVLAAFIFALWALSLGAPFTSFEFYSQYLLQFGTSILLLVLIWGGGELIGKDMLQ